ncbi:HsdR family type I site-specific deoxyribonuclease [Altererythrobacter indicus]|uniref:Type I restriction enzyme endonuclease subunit n=1 Tax=Altericroceibacterium indicum TaxID=374177 RepID=A0A845A7X7_9SPHN|nr:type I restriction endonuclease subunit R [Altericroceibacterium indicum]MXP25794.1 HsdR family type I site-specific deoxyribonuclease [Altericroceibacterium indicum]
MFDRPRSERVTQDRLVRFITEPEATGGLGYDYLGDWSKRDKNRCVEPELLRANLIARGYTSDEINAALTKLMQAIEVTGTTLYQANMRTYTLLRYGVDVQTSANEPFKTIHLVDWDNPDTNDFALAEEVTIRGGHERRPDLVVYLNGLAVAVIELKRSSVEIGDGIRQLISNQEEIFNAPFFATAQLLLAGNDTQGLRYGTMRTPETYFVEWRDEDPPTDDLAPGALLDRPVGQMLRKERLLDLIRHFVIFDAGQKKVPRQHQFTGVKLAQERLAKREGGVIWHSQGSGKSILMVLLAKWILEHDPDARVLIVTDRDELDKQIEGVMRNAGVTAADAPSPRVTKRDQFVSWLRSPSPRLICALIHKFDTTDLSGPPPKVHGRFYVFVDECHRTQGGDMNKQMKRWLEGAIFVGFTGTPLLKKDRQTTRDVFGTYIHTYKFQEAVRDKVVLDLKYEARDVPQKMTDPAAIDAWFEKQTKGLNKYQKAVLRKRWARMEELLSSTGRKQRIVAEIVKDFDLKPRLSDDRGTAILVADSIRDACEYFRLFQGTRLAGQVGIVTSFEPNHNAVSREPAKSDERYKFDTYTNFVLASGQSTGAYETEIKRRFIDEPANMKLIIVVSKLLTGFDAPSCTYIYLDDTLRDHNLFQAICRTNRLDGDDKEYGYIVDFKELFGKVQEAIAIYSSDELDVDQGDGGDNNVTIKEWLEEGKARLDAIREELHYLCEPVPPPREVEQFLRYFCGDAGSPEALLETEPLRIAFYKSVASFVRAYGALAANLEEAGYSATEQAEIVGEVEAYADLRAAVKRHSGEELDIKPYEADMRHLLNTYIEAEAANTLGTLSKVSLTEAIIETGIHDAIAKQLNEKGKLSKNAIAEGIINNIRKTIIREQLTDPRFYEEMSKLLEDLIKHARESAEAYEEFLREAEELVRKLAEKEADPGLPAVLQGNREAAVIYSNLTALPATTFVCPSDDDERANLALEVDIAVRERAPAGWKGDPIREKEVKNTLFPLFDRDRDATMAIFKIIKSQPGY